MAYTVIDIINKGINIAKIKRTIYEKIYGKKGDIPSMKIMAKVLIKEENRIIQYYESLIKEFVNEEFEEINFVTYDKISFLINNFVQNLYVPDVNNVRDLLKFSLDLEKDAYSLLVDVQGRLVRSTSDIHTKTYKLLTNVINNVSRHIASLEKTLK